MDGLVLQEIPLQKERTSIGRKPHNDIQIDNLAISGEHAVIVRILNDSFLEDLNSTNGTYVNGHPVKKHFLQNNDIVELGKYKLKFVAEVAARDTAELEKTMVLRRSADAAPSASGAWTNEEREAALQTAPPAMGPDAAGAAAERAVIQILNGPNAGRELTLVKTLTTLGKPGIQVAVIARRPHGFFITHVEGATYPIVNGTTLDAQAHPLHDHDIVELAGVKMEFFFKR
jgi:hypothetical protein